MNHVAIRQFETADAGGIVELHSQFKHWFEEPEVTLDYVIGCSLRPDFRFYVAVNDSILVGYAGVLFHQNAGRAEVGPVCVSDGFRNMGVGSRLLDEAIGFLRERSVHRVTAKVKSGNNDGVGFFEMNGFKKEAVLKRYTKKGEDAVQLVRFL